MRFKIEVKSEGCVKIMILLRHGSFLYRGITKTQKRHIGYLRKEKRKHVLAEMNSLTSDC